MELLQVHHNYGRRAIIRDKDHQIAGFRISMLWRLVAMTRWDRFAGCGGRTSGRMARLRNALRQALCASYKERKRYHGHLHFGPHHLYIYDTTDPL